MDISCPHCGFAGSIQDELIPESGRAVNCPRCKKKFFVTPDIPVMEFEEGAGADTPPASPEIDDPKSPGKPGSVGKALRKQDTVKTVFVAFGLIFGMFLCFYAGRLSLGASPFTTAPLTPAKPPTGSPGPMRPEKPLEVTAFDADLPMVIIPRERFIGAETIDITKVDEKIAEFSALPDPDRKAKMRAFAGELVGKNISGNFTVTRFGEVSLFLDQLLTKNEKSYFIEGAGDTKSPTHARLFLTVEATPAGIAPIEKAKKIAVTGFIMSCRVSDVLDLSVINAAVRATR